MNQKDIKKYWDTIDDNPLVIVSRLRGIMSDANSKWADDAIAFVGDDDFSKVLKLVLELMDGSMPDPAKVAAIIVRLESYGIKFRIQKNAYMSYEKGTTEANAKKNFYYSIVEGIDRLCDGLKYLAR